MTPEWIDATIRDIGELADRMGLEAYVVGGYVRDSILKRPLSDFDVMVVGDAIVLAEAFAKQKGISTVVVYRNFGTAMVPVVSDTTRIEFASARRESYDRDSRKPHVVPADLQSDLARRDFTINTLAMHINAAAFGHVEDPFDGRRDLDRQIIRTPLDPDQTFSDDPLRMMRAVRFAAQLQFTIDPATLDGIRRNASRLDIVSQERITDELLKILGSTKPSVGLYLMQDTGLLEIVLPELSALAGVEQQKGYLHKDVFKHTLKVLDNICDTTDDVRLRFAALMHDIGKPRTKRFIEGTGWTFHGHEDVGHRMVKGIGKKMKLSTDFIDYAAKMVRLHMRPIQLVDDEVTDSAIRRLIFDSGQEVDDLLTLCRADITSGNKERARRHLKNFDHVLQRVREVEEKDRLRAFQPPIKGEEIMQLFNIPPGKKVGQLKKLIEEAILDGIIPNEYQAAYDYLMQHKDEVLKEKA